ncbi:MAG: serine hydrolase [Steroidobacteraceae bacterium]
MRKLMIAITLVLLLLTSSAVGLLAADWPFWQRAWAWHQQTWPDAMPGARIEIAGAPEVPWPFPPTGTEAGDPILLRAAAGAGQHEALLVLDGERLLFEQYGPGVDAATRLSSRELASVLPALLYGIALAAGTVPGLDSPVRSVLTEWRDDPRGNMTPRQLLWNLSGLESPALVPWNPLHRRARLASGPDFARAALDFRLVYPAGSHFEPSPANPQLMGLLLERAAGMPFAQYLQTRLWQPLGAGPASAMADRTTGRMALHCCFDASARDWLRVGALLANGGEVATGKRRVRVLPPTWLEQMSTAAAVNPGYGLGLEVARTRSGARLLHLGGSGRDLWIVPEKRLVVLHFRRAAQPPDGAFQAALQAM